MLYTASSSEQGFQRKGFAVQKFDRPELPDIMRDKEREFVCGWKQDILAIAWQMPV